MKKKKWLLKGGKDLRWTGREIRKKWNWERGNYEKYPKYLKEKFLISCN